MKTVLLCLMFVFLSACATHYAPDSIADPYGFFSGVWHGMIFPYSLFIILLSWLLSLVDISFLSNVQIIGRPNTGLWYYIGFGVGLLVLGGAGSS